MKLSINSRHDKNIVVLFDKAENQKGLAFVMHGLGGFKEQPHIRAIADSFLEHNISVVRFDARDSFGESDGEYENATLTGYYDDLEDVIEWAEKQEWYEEPYLAGHSLGGLSVALFAQNYPEKVKGLAPISTVVSGELFLEAFSKEELEEIRSAGYKIDYKPDRVKKLKWKPFEKDLVQYDLLSGADKLTMPVLMIVGENDTGTPPKHQRLLFNKLRGKRELHVIRDAPHVFKEERHLEEVKEVVGRWLSYF